MPEVFRLVGISEIQIVRHGQRSRAGTGEISRGFRHRDPSAFARIEPAIERITVRRRRENLVRFAHAEDSGIRARQDDGSGPHHVIVLPVDPVLRRDGRIAQEHAKRFV